MTYPDPLNAEAWPENFQGCTLFGRYLGLDGVPVQGTISLAARAVRLADYGSDEVPAMTILPRALHITLDETGAFSVLVPATDDPDISPIDWTYQVTEEFPGGSSYALDAPQNTSVDITLAAPLPDAQGDPVVRGPRGERGEAGGVASVQGVGPTPDGDVDLAGVVLLSERNGSDIPDPAAFRDHLNLGSAAGHPAEDFLLLLQASGFMSRAANLSDVVDQVQALTNLGLSPQQIRATLDLVDVATASRLDQAFYAAIDEAVTRAYARSAQGAYYYSPILAPTALHPTKWRAAAVRGQITGHAHRRVTIRVRLVLDPDDADSRAERTIGAGMYFSLTGIPAVTDSATTGMALSSAPGLRVSALNGYFSVHQFDWLIADVPSNNFYFQLALAPVKNIITGDQVSGQMYTLIDEGLVAGYEGSLDNAHYDTSGHSIAYDTDNVPYVVS